MENNITAFKESYIFKGRVHSLDELNSIESPKNGDMYILEKKEIIDKETGETETTCQHYVYFNDVGFTLISVIVLDDNMEIKESW